MSFENQTYLASKKVDGEGNEIDCIISINNALPYAESQLDGLQADGWVIISKLKFDSLAAAYNEGKMWFWDSRNIPHATELERDVAEATYMER
jgi:hypothetical protein